MLTFTAVPALFLVVAALVTAGVTTANGPQTRINGGNNAEAGRFPYIVSLQLTPFLRHFCAGTLIAPDVVLTAAHCLIEPPHVYAVRTRPYDLRKPVNESKIFPVAATVLHPDYLRGAFRNDVALMKIKGTDSSPLQQQPPLVKVNPYPNIPYVGERLTQMGWGDLTNFQRDYPSILQVLEGGAQYIDNMDCEQRLQRIDITEDVLCTLEGHGQGVCRGDSGGPLIVQGTNPEEDVQVGIVSWGLSCSEAHVPSVLARTSIHFDFIRTTVCEISNLAPSYFDCPEKGEPPSIQPTFTTSPAPSGRQTFITVQLHLGRLPHGIGWRVETLTGDIIHMVDTFTYFEPHDFIVETIEVPYGEILNFVTQDLYGEGLENPHEYQPAGHVFLGETVNSRRVLCKVSYSDDLSLWSQQLIPESRYTSFTASAEGIIASSPIMTQAPAPSSSPSQSLVPTSSDTVEATVFIQFDTYPIHTSWEIILESSGQLLAAGGPYSPFVGDSITKTVLLQANQLHCITVFDEKEDGMCCDNGFGELKVYLGTALVPDQVLAYENGRFQESRSHFFVAGASETFTVTPVPSASPSTSDSPSVSQEPSSGVFTVTVSVVLDDSPSETSWSILDADGAVIAEEGFDSALASTLVHNTLQLGYGTEYSLRVLDAGGNGLCCGGLVLVNAGRDRSIDEALEEQAVLALIYGDFGSIASVLFVASPMGLIDAALPPRPAPPTEAATTTVRPQETPTPYPFFPSTSSIPTGFQTDVTVEVELRFNQNGIGVLIETTTEARRTVFEIQQIVDTRLYREVIQLDLGREYLFTITDSTQGNGLGAGKYVTVYLGREADIGKAIMQFEGNFGFVRKQFFVVSEDSLIGFTSIPSRSPSTVPSEQPSLSLAPSTAPSLSVRPTHTPSAMPTVSPSLSFIPSQSMAPSRSRYAQILIMIELDDSPEDVGWKLWSYGGPMVASIHPGTYTEPSTTVSEIVTVEAGGSYTLIFEDAAGDGYCCQSGNGRALVFLGTEPNSNTLLVYEDGQFERISFHYLEISTAFTLVPPQTESPSPVPLETDDQSVPPTRKSRKGSKAPKLRKSYLGKRI